MNTELKGGLFVSNDTYYFKASWFQLLRPLTASGTLSPVVVAVGFAAMQGPIHIDLFILTLISALCMQLSGNMLNDYFDFKIGQDRNRWLLNPEGQAHGPAFERVPYLAALLLSIAAFTGIWLALLSSFWVIVFGVLGAGSGIAYSAGGRYSLSALGFGELATGIFMGCATFLLAYAVQGYTISLGLIEASLPFAFLIASMVLTNNIRDMEKDLPFRRTIPLRAGKDAAQLLLLLLLFIPYGVIFSLMFFRLLTLWGFLVVLALPFCLRLLYCLRSGAARSEKMAGMKWAALHHWAFGLLFAASVWLPVFLQF